MAFAQTLSNLREALTCPRCNDLFKEPKTLQCLHTFCSDCLKEAGSGEKKNTFPCPFPGCKSIEAMETPNIKDMAVNLAYKNMVEYLMLEERVRNGSGTCTYGEDGESAVAFCSECNDFLCESCKIAHSRPRATRNHKVKDFSSGEISSEEGMVTHTTWKCGAHPEDVNDSFLEVNLYCNEEGCKVVICRECGIVEPHGNHRKLEADKIINDKHFKPKIKESEEKVKDVQGKFSTFISEMKDLQNRLESHRAAAKDEIEERMKQIEAKLKKQKEELEQNIEKIFEAKNKRLQDQIEELQGIEEKLKDSRKRVNDALSLGIAPEILYNMDLFINRMKSLFDDYDTYDRTPHENDILKFEPKTNFNLAGAIGKVGADPFPEAFTLEGLESTHFIQGEEATLTVTCRDIAGSPRLTEHDIKVEFGLPNEEHCIDRIEKDVQKEIYSIKLQPGSHGKHVLAVSVIIGKEGKVVPIKGSPFLIDVARPLVTGIVAENKAIEGLKNPWGVAVKCGTGPGEAQEVEENGERREDGADWGAEDGRNEQVENGDIIAITDIGSQRVLVLNNNFQIMQWIGKEGGGVGKLEFKSPRGVAFNNEGHIVVVEKENCRVQVISPKGEFKFMFGKRGTKDGEFNQPRNVAIDAKGVMYISDTENNRIQYFSANGKFLGKIVEPGGSVLTTPYALTCDCQGRILVTEQGALEVVCLVQASDDQDSCECSSDEISQHRIKFDRVFKSQRLSAVPLGVTHHPETGYIIVTPLAMHQQISILDKNGKVLGMLGTHGEEDNNIMNPKGVAVMGDSRLIMCDCEKKKLMIFPIV